MSRSNSTRKPDSGGQKDREGDEERERETRKGREADIDPRR